jgi:predicted amidohydrolase
MGTMRVGMGLLCAVVVCGAELEWKVWAPREETAPRAFRDAGRQGGARTALGLAGQGNPAALGGWEALASGIEPGAWYRLTAYYRASGAGFDASQAQARIDWNSAAGKRAGQPDIAYRESAAGAWRKLSIEAPAPPAAATARVQLLLTRGAKTTLLWDDITFEKISAPAARPVRIATINSRPARSASAAESVNHFVSVIEATVPAKTDLILLPEGISIVGTGKKYADVAEPIPGPSTERLGEVARQRRAWIAAGIYERAGTAVYNTAVLLDREGRLAGKYRKVYLPREEMEGGITPGDDYPVFDTDFGRVGMMICWDVSFADPARSLALRGAEIILMPIWGGNQTLGKARAIENQVFVVSSGYDYPSEITAPDGEVVANAPQRGQAAVATIDLAKRYLDPWLGEVRARFRRELRLDIPPLAK